jgi:hypothetical protein
MDSFICRHCRRPIAVPASKCPWCGGRIMVICANCKAYTDDQKSHCEHCGAPLQPDRMERIAAFAHHPEIARMAQDREQAQLVASAVVINNLGGFFYADGEGRQMVLVELLGSAGDRTVVATAVILAAYAYLCQRGYCTLQFAGAEEEQERIELTRLRPWDGQQSIEGALTEEAERALITREATEQALRALMGFRMMTVEGGGLSAPRTRYAPERTALTAVDQTARLTVLPEHDPREVIRATNQLLTAFVKADWDRARWLALETMQLLDEFERYR